MTGRALAVAVAVATSVLSVSSRSEAANLDLIFSVCEYRKAFAYRTEGGYQSDDLVMVALKAGATPEWVRIATDPSQTATQLTRHEANNAAIKVSRSYFDYIETIFAGIQATKKPVKLTITTRDTFVGAVIETDPAGSCP